jgi:hypothetical protein
LVPNPQNNFCVILCAIGISLHKSPDPVVDIKRRVEWLVHVMDQTGEVEEIVDSTPGIKR